MIEVLWRYHLNVISICLVYQIGPGQKAQVYTRQGNAKIYLSAENGTLISN
jgi:hypothetical protein